MACYLVLRLWEGVGGIPSVVEDSDWEKSIEMIKVEEEQRDGFDPYSRAGKSISTSSSHA